MSRAIGRRTLIRFIHGLTDPIPLCNPHRRRILHPFRNATRENPVFSKSRLIPAGLLPIATALMVTAGSAHASGLTVNAANCPTVQDSQAFLAWGDPSEYFLAPDGNFANSGASWTLTGGAGAIAGGDGYSLGANPVSTRSLALPNGSSATTPSICVGINSPTVRFVAQNTGAPTSTLEVSATVDTTTGLNVTLPIGDISAAGTWSPTLPLPVVANLLPLLPGNETPITFTFTPQGQGGHWQIDDLFVDPWTRGGGGG